MLGKENIGKQIAGNQSNREGTLLPNSQQILKLPEGFEVKEAIDGGDCFFDAVAQGLKQLKPDMEFTIKSLRQICKNLALSDQQLKEQVIKDAKSFHDPTVIPSCPTINDDGLWNAYLAGIEYTAEDMKRMETQEPHLYKALTNSKYGSTLQILIWGRPNIEGKMICSTYKVKLHIIENLPHAGWSNQLVDGLESRSIDYIDYSEGNTIHIINKGNSHFKPILKKQILPHCSDTIVSEKKSDSKSVYFQQVSEKNMTDNQMDYVDAESTIGAKGGLNHEGRLSSGELQCGQSQQSPRVTRSSFASSGSIWYSASSDDERTPPTILQ